VAGEQACRWQGSKRVGGRGASVSVAGEQACRWQGSKRVGGGWARPSVTNVTRSVFVNSATAH